MEKLQECLVECESNIITSIPEDILVQHISDLDYTPSNDLRDKQDIIAVKELLEYYVAMQTFLTEFVLVSGAISSILAASEARDSAGDLTSSIDCTVKHISKVTGASILLTVFVNSNPKERVSRVVKMFRNDVHLISQVAETIAREMAKFNKDELVGEGKKNANSSSAE